ncbi:acyltransferase [Novosphingobium sp. TH158]|uniref:acyltransferase family protein n=1 Tax=Novosphingobium sp. TH158 TaxID=2067455 RepID=UPI000C7BBA26|nr:acyltransferase [Novosphingobium sp. TH158]PLK27554.1 acyltransferase [Novosphingobium sp. TH158]
MQADPSRPARGPFGTGPDTLVSVQYLRALAALMVLVTHGVGPAGGPVQALGAGVDLFFLISGFIMIVTTGEQTTPRTFMIRRIVRVVPLYWLLTLLAVLTARYIPMFHYPIAWWQALASFLFVPVASAWNPEMARPVIGLGWTLNHEMQFYALFAAALFLPCRWLPWVVGGTICLLVAAGIVLAPSSPAAAFWLDPVKLEFVAGIVVAVAWQRRVRLARLAAIFALLGALGIGLLAAGLLGVPGNPQRPLLMGLFVPVLCLALWLEQTGRLPRWRWAMLLGDASYSIYLCQFFVLLAFAGLELRLGAPPMLRLPFVLAGGIALGLVVHFAFERPVHRALLERLRIGRAGSTSLAPA